MSRSDVVCVLSRSAQVNFVIALIFSQVDLEAGAHESALGSAVTQTSCTACGCCEELKKE